MLGGAAAAVIGGVGGVVTAETGVGAAAGYFVLVNGIDNAVAGAKQMWTGETSQTVIYSITEQSSVALGASPETATNIASSVDFGASMFGGGSMFNKKALPAVQNATNSLADDFITMRLRHHVNKSVKEVDRLGIEALTTPQIKASIKHPNLLPAFRGNRIDVMTRDKVKADKLLRPFKINSNYRNGPYFTRGNRWWDMTTPQQWQRHVDKYGPNGTLLNTAPKR